MVKAPAPSISLHGPADRRLAQETITAPIKAAQPRQE